ncbi:hypothetical protein BZA70DRAFT_268547 [Myxozyma melibiosi]|uniref:Pentatricopeptide repeat protein n=1 Tax=Myxozyma melibiosi TaxID=54550 RepID=A0ABR1F2S6_9ASCO
MKGQSSITIIRRAATCRPTTRKLSRHLLDLHRHPAFSQYSALARGTRLSLFSSSWGTVYSLEDGQSPPTAPGVRRRQNYALRNIHTTPTRRKDASEPESEEEIAQEEKRVVPPLSEFMQQDFYESKAGKENSTNTRESISRPSSTSSPSSPSLTQTSSDLDIEETDDLDYIETDASESTELTQPEEEEEIDPIRDIRFAHNFMWAAPTDGIFQPQLSYDRAILPPEEQSTQEWSPPDHIKPSANLSLSYFIEALSHELDTIPRYPSAKVVECRILPILRRAQDNPTPYNMIKEYLVRDYGRATGRLINCLCTAFARPGVPEYAFEALVGLFVKTRNPTEVAKSLRALPPRSALLSAARKLSIPNTNRLIMKIVNAKEEESIRLLAVVLVQLALNSGHELTAALIYLRLARELPGSLPRLVARRDLGPDHNSDLMDEILKQLIASLDRDPSPERLKAVVSLWRAVMDNGGALPRTLHITLLEKALLITEKMDEDAEAVELLPFPDGRKIRVGRKISVPALTGPVAILDHIRKQEEWTLRKTSVPTAIYLQVIARHMKAGNMLAAADMVNQMIARENSSINMVPHEVTAKLVRGLARNRYFQRAQDIVLQFNRGYVRNPFIQAVLLNLGARTENRKLVNQTLRLVPRPVPRQILRELLYVALRLKDAEGRRAVIDMIEGSSTPLTPIEYSVLIEQTIAEEGLRYAHAMVEKRESYADRKAAWDTLMLRGLQQGMYDIASEGTKHSRRGAYYVTGLLMYISRQFGTAEARQILQRLLSDTIDVNVVTMDDVEERKVTSSAEKQLQYARLMARLLNQDDDPVKLNLRATGIRSSLFLPRSRYTGFIRPKREDSRPAEVDESANGLEHQVIAADYYDESIFDGARASFITVEWVGRYALFSGDARTYNWALLTLESMGMSPDHIDELFKDDQESCKPNLYPDPLSTDANTAAETNVPAAVNVNPEPSNSRFVKAKEFEFAKDLEQPLSLRKTLVEHDWDTMREVHLLLSKVKNLASPFGQRAIDDLVNRGLFDYDVQPGWKMTREIEKILREYDDEWKRQSGIDMGQEDGLESAGAEGADTKSNEIEV